jgi:hypothetical protein
MTIAPSLPLVHGYEGANPYEIIPSKWGKTPNERPSMPRGAPLPIKLLLSLVVFLLSGTE